MNHLDFTLLRTGQKSGAKQKGTQSEDLMSFYRALKSWGFALGVSLVPSVFVFIFHTGPQSSFDCLELFQDNSLLYLCVTLSALSLYICEKLNWIGFINIIVIFIGMLVYVTYAIGISLPFFDIFDRRGFIAWFLVFSISLGFLSMVYSYIITKGRKL